MEPRDWQLEAARTASLENIIVYADTGSGKTMVAELAIKESLRKQPMKCCAFMVTATRLLAHQQCLRLADSCATSVTEVTGYTTFDWGWTQWRDCVKRSKVLVGTIEIFARALCDRGVLSFEDFSLFVVDECHRATGNSPGAELLQRLHCTSPGSVRVLGLTASFANEKATSEEEFRESRNNLQAILQAKMHCCSVPRRQPPTFHRVTYPSLTNEQEAHRVASELCEVVSQRLQRPLLQKLLEQLKRLLRELGRTGFLYGIRDGLLAQLEAKLDNYRHMTAMGQAAKAVQADISSLEKHLPDTLEEMKQQPALRSLPATSPKVEALLRCLKQELAQSRSCGMVFVSQVVFALPLAKLLTERLEGVPVGVVSGVNSMPERQRNAAFADFRQSRIRLLVCTTCAEEGLDVAECSFVVRFCGFDTTRSHVQGVGRARALSARVLYFENEPPLECYLAEVMDKIAREPQGQLVPLMATPDFCTRCPVHPFLLVTGAEVNFRNAHRILAEYASVVAGVSLSKLLEEDALLLPGPQRIRVPESAAADLVKACPVQVDSKVALKYLSVLVLHSLGWLDQHNGAARHVQAALWEDCPSQPGLSLRFGQSETHSGESERLRHASGAEQVSLGKQRLDPECIHNTQATVNRTFSNGKSVMAAMVDLALSRTRPDSFPPLRVTWHPQQRRWLSADNRRLFAFKVVKPLIGLQEVEVDAINCTSEFESKLQQTERYGDVWPTHGASVALVRQELCQLLAGENEFEPGMSLPPSEMLRRSAEILEKVASLVPSAVPCAGSEGPGPGPKSAKARSSGELVEPKQLKSMDSLEREPKSTFMPDGETSCEVGQPLSLASALPGEPRERLHDFADLLRRVGQSLAKNPCREEEETAVVLLQEALQCHLRPGSEEEVPVSYQDFGESPPFRTTVVVAGRRFVGGPANTKRLAKRGAAAAAIRGLVRLAEESQSPRSDRSWQMLETELDLPMPSHESHGGAPPGLVRVELLLEPPSHCSSFDPKSELQQVARISPRFAGEGSFWQCRLQVDSEQLGGCFWGTPAETKEQAEQNACWSALMKLRREARSSWGKTWRSSWTTVWWGPS
ncbi:unnamed protein product [Effrenium voratum]|uniref:Uncharacterized protein n=1 Tax=Effrenium voratum TaxID=2562239 RepID=A0AA36JJL9_9DINO|nr:unnamed protein product [Effrenium voratum]